MTENVAGTTSAPAGSSGTGSTTSLASSHVAALRIEARRLRLYAFFVAGLTALAIAVVFVLGGDPTARAVHLVGIAVAFAVSVRTLVVTHPETRYVAADSVPFAIGAAIGISSGYHYWGELSAVVLMVPIGVFVYGLGLRTSAVVYAFAITSVWHWVLICLLMAGAIDDVGIIGMRIARATDILIVAGLVQSIFVFSIVFARATGAASRRVIEELESTTRLASRRAALLDEAKAELERAGGVGGVGRYTGQTFGGFQLGVVIGRGAMGEVYEASSATTGELAAIKMLPFHALGKPKLVERFMREADVVGSLRTPHVVRLLPHDSSAAPLPFIVMERLHGRTLAALLRDGRLSRAQAVKLVTEVADGLAAAHAAGVIHRDIKPSNLFLHQSGERQLWKVLDFGVSKLVDGDGTLTKGGVVGTPAYMAPEQTRDDEVDQRADIYSLGLVLYRVLCGRPAFVGSQAELLDASRSRMPPQPSRLADLPHSIDSVLAIALSKTPSERFGEPRELATAIAAALDDGGAHDRERVRATRARARRILATHPWQ